jgi:hypothetical protein
MTTEHDTDQRNSKVSLWQNASLAGDCSINVNKKLQRQCTAHSIAHSALHQLPAVAQSTEQMQTAQPPLAVAVKQ